MMALTEKELAVVKCVFGKLLDERTYDDLNTEYGSLVIEGMEIIRSAIEFHQKQQKTRTPIRSI